MTLYVAPIVEGQTEQGCVERLLHRVWAELLQQTERLQVLGPFRGYRDALVHGNGQALTQAVQKAFLKARERTRREPEGRLLLLLLLDAEGDCPATLAPRLLQTARQARGDADIACVLAKRMTENWIAAGAAALAGVNGLPNPLSPPPNPEDGSGAGWLDARLRSVDRRRKYTKTADAKVFVEAMHLRQCRETAPSFDKLCRDLQARVPPPATGAKDEAPAQPPPASTKTGSDS